MKITIIQKRSGECLAGKLLRQTPQEISLEFHGETTRISRSAVDSIQTRQSRPLVRVLLPEEHWAAIRRIAAQYNIPASPTHSPVARVLIAWAEQELETCKDVLRAGAALPSAPVLRSRNKAYESKVVKMPASLWFGVDCAAAAAGMQFWEILAAWVARNLETHRRAGREQNAAAAEAEAARARKAKQRAYQAEYRKENAASKAEYQARYRKANAARIAKQREEYAAKQRRWIAAGKAVLGE